MGVLEKNMLGNCPLHLRGFIHTWKRYIDDILLIWTGSWDQFMEFYTYLNNCHQTMKFDKPTHNHENNSCDFLDMTISIKEGKVETDLYRKDTAKPRALLPSSAHPNYITSNIIYSMGFRLLRICSNESTFENRLKELKNDFLIPRQYKPRIIDTQFKRIRDLPGTNYEDKRKEALKKKEKEESQNKDRIIAPFDFNPLLPKISSILQKHHKSLLFNHPELKQKFGEPPMSALRQGPNIRKMICRSRLSDNSRANNFKRGSHFSAQGWRKCGKPCPTCPFTLPPVKSLRGLVNNYEHEIKTAVNCQTSNGIYYWKCTKPNCSEFPKCEYIGMSSRRFQKRFYEHQYYIKSEKITEPSGEHFSLPGHSLHDLKGMVIEKVRNPDPFILRAREALLIQKFDTFNNGLNKEP